LLAPQQSFDTSLQLAKHRDSQLIVAFIMMSHTSGFFTIPAAFFRADARPCKQPVFALEHLEQAW